MHFAARTTAALAVTAAAALGAIPAAAQDYPNRPVRVIVPYTPGGTTDIYARLVASALQKEFGQTFIVENRPGASTQVAAAAVARSAPDGYTLLMATTSTMAINPLVFKSPTYNVDDLVPVSLVAQTPYAMVVPGTLPYDNVGALVTYAKANPGKLNFGTPGVGSSGHLVAEFAAATMGIKAVPIHYRGSAPTLTGIMAGEIQFYFDSISTSLPLLGDGRMKMLAITSDKRASAAPTVPTFVEAGYPDVVAFFWVGIVAPKGTPPAVIDRVNSAINKFMTSPEMQTRMTTDAAIAGSGSPADFARMIERETEVWRRVLKPLDVKLD
jgi:tripartite-type tricarboxylate transporter receptor subunit TctC